MPEPAHQEGTPPASRPRARWWPALLILALAGLAVFYFLIIREDSQQWRNLDAMVTCVVAGVLLLLWMLFLSRLRWKVRLLVFGSVAGLIGVGAAMFEIRGVTGDLIPILRFRWSHPAPSTGSSPVNETASASRPAAPAAALPVAGEFPQFLGPHRNATLPDGPALSRDWKTRPPVKLWRQPIGAGWSGFAIAGERAVTQEQRGEEELVVCYELRTGRPLWSHADTARYFTTLAGEGPRATPGISGDKVVTLGSTGILNCLDLATGRVIWNPEEKTGAHWWPAG
jgi:outer membrane protein assembly factor BamB